MFHAITKQEAGGSRLLNFLIFGDDFFIQRQVEQKNGYTFMRAKKRVM